MKSITIHNLDRRTADLIEQKARESGLSLNKTIKKLLQKALGISSENEAKINEFKEFSGVWDEADFDEFERNVRYFGDIDKNDWK